MDIARGAKMRKPNLYVEASKSEREKGLFLRERTPGMDTGFDRTLLAIWSAQRKYGRQRIAIYTFPKDCERNASRCKILEF
jgi:hypothetical protein